jgi:hypothetical protein
LLGDMTISLLFRSSRIYKSKKSMLYRVAQNKSLLFDIAITLDLIQLET